MWSKHSTLLWSRPVEEVQTDEGSPVISYSMSHALWELQASAVRWPATVKPWFNGTMLANGGTENAYLHSFVAHCGAELAGHLHVLDGELVHLLAGIPFRDGWDIRTIVELKIGKVGSSTMMVARDAEGNQFCPDAPQLPAASVLEQVQVVSVVAPQRPKRDDPLLSLGLVVHYQVARKAAGTAEPPAQAEQTTV